MKILHTSDWHLGRSLYGRKRYEEFQAFLEWLIEYIIVENIDALLVCGDIFDTNTPSNRAQELYYKFLYRVSRTNCRHIIVIAGNHDSPSFLEAPRNLLQALNIHVVGTADTCYLDEMEPVKREENTIKEIIVLSKDISDTSETNNLTKNTETLSKKENEENEERKEKETDTREYQGIICAVPYLRDRDVRKSELGESFEEKNTKLRLGIEKHYAFMAEKAQEIQKTILQKHGYLVPIIGLGHLFAAGGATMKGDGVRDLYVGSLVTIGADSFSPCFDYVALGHLHVAQKVNKNEYIRYCGSPLPMSFGEAKHIKKVFELEVRADRNQKNIEKNLKEVDIPCFQELIQISGDLGDITAKIDDIISHTTKNNSPWLEIEYTGKSVIANLRKDLEILIIGTKIEILRIKNSVQYEQTLRASEEAGEQDVLNDLSVLDVFEKRLESRGVPEEEREELRQTYQEILRTLSEKDTRQE